MKHWNGFQFYLSLVSLPGRTMPILFSFVFVSICSLMHFELVSFWKLWFYFQFLSKIRCNKVSLFYLIMPDFDSHQVFHLYLQSFILWYSIFFWLCSCGLIGKLYLCQSALFLNRYSLVWFNYLLLFNKHLLSSQFKLSSADMERLDQATTQEAHKEIFEQLANNLPVITRNPQSGRIIIIEN